MKKPLISIVTVNYREPEVTVDFLKSLHDSEFRDFEVIVVENAPLIDYSDSYLEAYEEVIVIKSPDNLGFAGGNNLGIRSARGEFVFLLNNDTEVTSDLLGNCLQAFERPEIGVVCPKIKYFYKQDTIQFAGFSEINTWGSNTMIGFNAKDDGRFDERRSIPYGHGAAMMLRRQAIEDAGLMPESYFLYYEELDWSVRIREAGYEIWFQPDAEVFHKVSVSTGQASPLKTYYMTRNRILFMRKNAEQTRLPLFIIYFLFVAFPKHLLTHLTGGRWQHVQSVLRGTWQGLFNRGWYSTPIL